MAKSKRVSTLRLSSLFPFSNNEDRINCDEQASKLQKQQRRAEGTDHGARSSSGDQFSISYNAASSKSDHPFRQHDTFDHPSKTTMGFNSKQRSDSEHPTMARSRAGLQNKRPSIWIAELTPTRPYNVLPLVNAQPVLELWDDSGDILVYLFSGKEKNGASFKIQSTLFASSSYLMALACGTSSAPQVSQPVHFDTPLNDGSIRSKDSSDAGRDNGESVPVPDAGSLCLPCDTDIDSLIGIRNLFAFLIGQSLICTERRPTLFSAFLQVSELLETYQFTDDGGSTFGQTATSSFDTYVSELDLADVRSSWDKTVNALVLGEKMRCITLFNEAFVHVVGRYAAIQQTMKSPNVVARFEEISPATKLRIERAAIDLKIRTTNVNSCLATFRFPSVFAGVMSSKSAVERKHINFESWKDGFSSLRRHVLVFYKRKHGAWPPKEAQTNGTSLPGLNRLVLKSLYEDFSNLYNLWADRTALATRTEKSQSNGSHSAKRQLLRRIFDEYNSSMPPSMPPIPFDVPQFPSLDCGRLKYGTAREQDQSVWIRKVDFPEIDQILEKSCDLETLAKLRQSSFIVSIREWEREQARSLNIDELIDLRAGAWIFVYAVLQALPMLVVDAPGLGFHQRVEYFLCQPPRPGVPWAQARRRSDRRSSYQSSDGSHQVQVPSQTVEHSVESVFRRSHCWQMARKWCLNLKSFTMEEFSEISSEKFSPVACSKNGFLYAPNPFEELSLPHMKTQSRIRSSSDSGSVTSNERSNDWSKTQSLRSPSSSSSILSSGQASSSSCNSPVTSGSCSPGSPDCQPSDDTCTGLSAKAIYIIPVTVQSRHTRDPVGMPRRWHRSQAGRRSYSSSAMSVVGPHGSSRWAMQTTATFDDIIRGAKADAESRAGTLD